MRGCVRHFREYMEIIREGGKVKMNEELKKARNEYMREYMREYREKNREKINAQQREWTKNNPEKVREYQERFWSKKLKA